MERLQFQQFDSVSFSTSGTNQAFTCLVQATREMECLDVAGATTLRNLLNETSFNSTFVSTPEGALRANILDQNDLMVDMLNPSIINLDSTTRYGMGLTCDGKRTGDGVINGMDMYVYAASLFRLGPYEDNPGSLADIFTVQGREDTQSRCNADPFERVEWQKRLAYSSCYALRDETAYQAAQSGRRLFQTTYLSDPGVSTPDMEPMRDLGAKVFDWAHGGTEGSWYLIQIPEINMVVDLFLRGAEAAASTPLSNEPPPQFNTTLIPEYPNDFHVRFLRHRELSEEDTSSCAIIQAAGDQLVALKSGWLSVSQRLPTEGSTRRALCGFDVVLWKPSWAVTHSCELQVAAGSTGLDGRLGAIQRHDTCAEPLGALYIVTSSPSPPALPSPPELPPPPPQAHVYKRTEHYVVEAGQTAYSTASLIRDTRRLQVSSLLTHELLGWSFTTEQDSGYSQHLSSGCNSTLIGVLTVIYTGSFDVDLIDSLPQNFSIEGTGIDSATVTVCDVTVEEDISSPPALPPPEPKNYDMALVVLLCIAISGCACACCFCVFFATRDDDCDDEKKNEKEGLLLKGTVLRGDVRITSPLLKRAA